MADRPETLADDLIWGVASIAAFIGRTPRQTWEALDKGQLPARQVNGRWCVSRSRLRTFFAGVDIGEAQSASPAPEPPLAMPKPSKATGKHKRATATIHKLTPRKGRAA
ncbi:hypothetical protein ASD04_14820 [Devosia sp. Root436]|uniref:hypothetical protein n=1 Tax=Devosia sp. Root436 TaxID=1736537 RepID=UPI0006F4AC2C|nr:hypothetical protein [Devosia sp. Root436]KQX35311.1 hypothetical protein ASD04_14820 [Devosia sp. Root436]